MKYSVLLFVDYGIIDVRYCEIQLTDEDGLDDCRFWTSIWNANSVSIFKCVHTVTRARWAWLSG